MKNFTLPFLAIFITVVVTSCQKLDSAPPPSTISISTTPAIDSLKVGLIAHYSFNNSGVDSSGNGHNATIYNGVVTTTNRFNVANTAYHFDGTTGYMVVKDSNDLRLNNTDFTINTWIYLEEYNSSYGTELLCKRGTGTANGWNYGITGKLDQYNSYALGVTSFQESGSLDPLALGTKAIPLNSWHMLTTIYNYQKKQMSFYIDGVLDTTIGGMQSPNAATTADLYIGQDSQTVGNTAYYVKGKLDDIRIYGRIISANQLQKLFTITY
jgi:hypothetical protein